MKSFAKKSSATGPNAATWVLVLCLTAIVFEGYDLVAYGIALPAMLADPSWGLGPAQAGLLGSYALIGMLVGSVLAGFIADYIDRRILIMFATTWFSVWTIVCAFSSNLAVFGSARFMVGIGTGILIPAAAALAVEFAKPGKGNQRSAIVWAGYPGGGVVAALVGLLVLEPLGPRAIFLIGGLPIVVILPLMLRYLPSSPGQLLAKGKREEAYAVADACGVARPVSEDASTKLGLGALFTRVQLAATLLLGLLSFCGLLLTYGLNTWLPALMRQSGYELGPALVFLLVLNAGAILVPLFASRLADRSGPQKVTSAAFFLAVLSLSLLSIKMDLPALYTLTFIAGAGTIGAQVLVYGFVANHYPASCRAAGLAWAASVGRVGGILGPSMTGFVVAAGYGIRINFYAFSAVALVGAIAALLVPRPKTKAPADGLEGTQNSMTMSGSSGLIGQSSR